MGKLKKSRIYLWLSRHSIVSQVTIIYSIIILVPSLIIGIAFINTMYMTRVDEADRANHQYLQQMRLNISENMAYTEALANKLQFDLEPQYYLFYGSQELAKSIYNGENLTDDEKYYYFGHAGKNIADEEKYYYFGHTPDRLPYATSVSDLAEQAQWNIGRGLKAKTVNEQISQLQISINSAYNTNPKQFPGIYLYSGNYLVEEKSERRLFIFRTDKIENEPYYEEVLASGNDPVWGNIRKQPIVGNTVEKLNIDPDNINPHSEKYVLPYYVKVLQETTNKYLGFFEYNIQVDKLVNREMLPNDENLIFLLWGEDGQLYYSSSLKSPQDGATLYPEDDSGIMEVSLPGNEKRRVMYESIPEANVKIGVMTSTSDITSQVLPAVLTLVIALAAGMVIVVFLSRLVAKNLFQRLTVLDNYIGKVQEGEFYDDFDVQGQDEVARIAGSFKSMTAQLNTMIQDIVATETAQKDAEMRALQAQINPHFLYNTLENLRMQCEMDEYYVISDKLYSLAKLMRYSIQKTGEPSTLGQELQALESYADLMSMRLSRPVVYKNKVEADVLYVKTPKMLLQPILENTFAHGQYAGLKKIVITVSGYRSGGYLIIKIADNGRGLTAEKREDIRRQLREERDTLTSGSIGLANVNKRLKTRYGEASGLKIYSNGKGTAVCFVIKRNDAEGVDESW